jgi:hypothetical protein
MRRRGVRNWPPIWTKARTEGNKTLTGEVGILRYVHYDNNSKSNKCFPVIEYELEYFVGTLIFDDVTFCRQIAELLREHVGCSIKEIGDLDSDFSL